MRKEVIIIGAGASGLMCAAAAGRRGRSVLILDHSDRIGKKIRVSGGGRCNFTNLNMDSSKYLSGNPHFCKSALARFTPHDFIALVERYRIQYYEKEPGRLFCKQSSSDILKMLQAECAAAGVETFLNCRILKIDKRDFFYVSTNRGNFQTESLVVATGGLSYPALGATDRGHSIARRFGIGVTELKPALVPFIFAPAEISAFGSLSGISFRAGVSCNKAAFIGEILFTHRGLSGPAILQISSYLKPGDVISIDLLPGVDIHDLLLSGKSRKIGLSGFLSKYLPARFVSTWCETCIGSRPLNRYNDKELKEIAGLLHNWEIVPAGTEGYKTAEVTLGGIDTNELSSRTMEAKKLPGLFFIGEVVDVTGQLGGYNLHWAWASGHAAGEYV